MASKKKPQSKPHWHLSFDVSPEITFTRDRQPCHKATVVARHGDLAYVSELELINWAQDIAAFFSRARLVFASGAPDFPNMAEEVGAEEPADTEEIEAETEPEDVPEEDAPVAEAEVYEEGEEEYDITFYPAGGSAEEIDPAQPSLW